MRGEKHRRDEVIDGKRGLVDGDEGPELAQGLARKRNRGKEYDRGDDNNRQREPALACSRQGRRGKHGLRGVSVCLDARGSERTVDRSLELG